MTRLEMYKDVYEKEQRVRVVHGSKLVAVFRIPSATRSLMAEGVLGVRWVKSFHHVWVNFGELKIASVFVEEGR